MENLARAFRARYLDTHEKYLDSITTLLPACDGAGSLRPGQFAPNRIDAVKTLCVQLSARNRFDETRALRNLRNSWYHECAFNYPEDRSERLKFAPWQIIQFYYVMYTALSAIVRCFDNRPNLSQRAALRLFTDDIVVNPEPIALPVPLCLYLQAGTIHPTPRSLVSWQYGLDNHIPRVERCLADLPAQNRAVSLFHYFKSLREWANYEDSYIFINLYGSSVIEMLDRSLRNIASAFCTFSEIFVICFFGWDKVHDQFTRFGFHMPGTLNVYPASLFARFEEYEKCAELTA